MNEPFMGTSANNILPLLLTAYAKLMAEETGKNPPSMDEMAAMFDSEESRLKALEFIASKERYKKVIDAAYELNTDFEKNQLQPMYQKVGNAIREVDKNHILFLEHGYFSNPGIASSIEPLKLKDGSTDHLIAYAAHGYDLVVDTKEVENPSYERVGFIFNRINETGKRMNVPVLVGEWGAFGGNSPKLVNPARQILNIFGKYNFSNTYWAFTSDMENLPYFQSALLKPNPVLISGTLIYSDFNFETGKFNCEWTFDSDNKKPSLFYIPNLKKVDIKDITVTPSPVKISLQPLGNSDAGYIVVESKGENGIHKFDFTLKH